MGNYDVVLDWRSRSRSSKKFPIQVHLVHIDIKYMGKPINWAYENKYWQNSDSGFPAWMKRSVLIVIPSLSAVRSCHFTCGSRLLVESFLAKSKRQCSNPSVSLICLKQLRMSSVISMTCTELQKKKCKTMKNMQYSCCVWQVFEILHWFGGWRCTGKNLASANIA